MHSIEFKFGMHISSHRRTNPIDFGGYRMNSFFTGVQKRIFFACIGALYVVHSPVIR